MGCDYRVDPRFGRSAFARTAAIATSTAMAPAAFFPLLHRRPRLARLLIPAGLSWLSRFAGFTGRAGLLVAALLVHVTARTLAVCTAVAAFGTIVALASGIAFGTRLARRTIATRRALLAPLFLRSILAAALALAIPATSIAVTAVASARTFATFVALLVAARAGLDSGVRCGLGGRGCGSALRRQVVLLEPAEDAADDAWAVPACQWRLRHGHFRTRRALRGAAQARWVPAGPERWS